MTNSRSSDFRKKIPKYVLKVSEKLISEGFEAYLVGGSIRDLIIGREPKDYDIATNAKPEKVEEIFPKSVATNAKFGTIIVLSKDEHGETFDVEVTTYRSEEDYTGGRWPSKVHFTSSIQDDLARRDFTINALGLDLSKKVKEGEVLDLYGGLKDLKNKIIQAVGDPMERFEEDGLRSFRGCRLASQLEFQIEPNTFKAIGKTLHISKKVSMERVRDEFLKMIMDSPVPSKGILLLKDSGLLGLFIPELLEGVGVVQPEYHADDVFTHSLKTLDLAEDSIKVAALLHDVGKPKTISKDKKGTHFYGHDLKGSEMVEEILRRLKFSKAEVKRNVGLVRWHMFYYPSADWRLEEELKSARKDSKDIDSISERALMKHRDAKLKDGWSDAAIRRFIRNAGGEDAIDDLMRLRIADAGANPKTSFHPDEIEALEDRISEVRKKDMALKVTDLDITGKDLQKLGVSPGPEMGKILNTLLEEVIDDPISNKKETLLGMVKSKYLSIER